MKMLMLWSVLMLSPTFLMAQEFDGDVDTRGHSPLITNGETAEPGQFPWQVAVYADTGDGRAFCGGSLIADSWVLTAAHCVHNMRGFTVVLGAHRLPDESEPSRQVFQVNVTEAKVHPGWSGLTLKNDIALLRLPTPALLNGKVSTIPLARSDLTLDSVGSVATVSGWGLQSDQADTTADYLQFVRQKIISNWLCNLYYMFNIRSTHVCMSGVAGKSTCQGDSGGPLIVEDSSNPGGWRQVGIVSFGIAFGCEVGWPGVFTRVSSYADYISNVTGISVDNSLS